MAIEPITREEKLMAKASGEDVPELKPITRREMFLAKAGGQDIEVPTPITREEMFLQKIAENGGGSGGSSDVEWVGDGNTHIWISLQEGRTSPLLGVCPNGTVTVDWGDGTTPDVLTGTSTSTVKWTPIHNYAESGDYVITLTVDGTMGLYGLPSANDRSGILRYSTGTDALNIVYQNAVQRVELGDSVTSIGNSAFSGCYSLTSVVIPNSVTSIDKYAFSDCPGVRYYDFTNHTAVPTLSATSAFSNISADCEIRVPAALYDEWIVATNWATYADKIVAV